MPPDESEWIAVNQQLKQQGLSPIVILNEINVNDYVWLTLDASKSIRSTIQTLIEDCQRKQDLVQEVIATNACLREQLKVQTSKINQSESIINDLKKILDSYGKENWQLEVSQNENSTKSYASSKPSVKKHHNKLQLVSKASGELEVKLKQSQEHCRKLESKIDKLKQELNESKKCEKSESDKSCRKSNHDLETVFKELNVDDVPDVLNKINSMQNNQKNYESIKSFISDIYSLISTVNESSIRSNRHGLICNKNLHEIKSILAHWSSQISLLPELRNSITELSLTLFPWKPMVQLPNPPSVQQLIDSVKVVSACKFRDDMVPVKDEKVTQEALHSIFEYIQILFGVRSVKGVYARMSGVYRQMCEQENMMRTLKEILGVEERATCSKIFDAVSRLCYAANQNSNMAHTMTHNENDSDHLLELLKEQDVFCSIFRNTISQLQTLLNIDSLDEIIPEVKFLIENRNKFDVS